jgi:hypothetical protein
LDLPEVELRGWLTTRPPWTRGYDYRRYGLPKRRGGTRTIDAPGDKLKALQRRVLHRLLNPVGVSAAATGFVPGRSIVDNARPHVGRAVVINLDLADFFPTITAQRVEAVWRALGWDAEAARILTAICTLDGQLPQGAPTSPALSNQVCRRLDVRLERLAAAVGGTYTRYADDITLSLPGLRDVRPRPRPSGWRRLPRASGQPAPRRARQPGPTWLFVRRLLAIIADEGFTVQRKKRIRIQRGHQRQTATGLVINAKVNLPRATRRLMRAMAHRERMGRLDDSGRRRLRGLLAFQRMVENQR